MMLHINKLDQYDDAPEITHTTKAQYIVVMGFGVSLILWGVMAGCFDVGRGPAQAVIGHFNPN